jgi:hypothetical protein
LNRRGIYETGTLDDFDGMYFKLGTKTFFLMDDFIHGVEIIKIVSTKLNTLPEDDPYSTHTFDIIADINSGEEIHILGIPEGRRDPETIWDTDLESPGVLMDINGEMYQLNGETVNKVMVDPRTGRLDEQLVNPGKKKNIKIFGDYPNGDWQKHQYNDSGQCVYYESSNGVWYKRQYDDKGNETYYEDSDGEWFKYQYDDEGNEIYYENNEGIVLDMRDQTNPSSETIIDEDDYAGLNDVSGMMDQNRFMTTD